MGGNDVSNRRTSITKVKGYDENIQTGPSSELSRIFGPRSNPTQQRKTPRKTHPNLKNRSESQLTASQIWTLLWSRSLSKLVQSDQKFPQDLKETFSAHVRQSIRQFRQPVFRSFTQAEDVSDLEKLMDHSKQEHIQRLRHQTKLMFGSSRINQDRAHILMYNNPLPLVSQGEQEISGFLLPAEYQESFCSEASYMRWLKAGRDTCKIATGQEHDLKHEHNYDTQKNSHGLGLIDHTNNNIQHISSGVTLADNTNMIHESSSGVGLAENTNNNTQNISGVTLADNTNMIHNSYPGVILAENTNMIHNSYPGVILADNTNNNTQENFPVLSLADVKQNSVLSKRRKEEQFSACGMSLVPAESDKLPDIFSPSHRQFTKQTRYHFLTEREAAVEGAFSHRFHSSLDRTIQNVDLLYWLGHQRASSAIQPPPQNFQSRHGSFLDKPVMSELLKRKVEDLQRQRSFPQSPWQPLSLAALSEYKKLVPAQGQGPFQQGGAGMWQQTV